MIGNMNQHGVILGNIYLFFENITDVLLFLALFSAKTVFDFFFY